MTSMRLLVPALVLFAAAAHAQTAAPPVQESQPLDPRKNQKIERIHVEDSAVKIDEVRYAGQTQSITVQPKGDMPSYEIVPANPARAGDSRRNAGGGERVWNVFNF
jgi:hypothetical protein